MSKPQTFQALAPKAQDMEVTIANRYRNSFGFARFKEDKAKFKRNVEFSKNSTKEAMSVFKVGPVRITKRLRWEEKMNKEASHTKRAPRK